MTLFIISFICSTSLGFIVYPLLKRTGIVDNPNHRSSHSWATPRGGGIGILVAAFIGMIAIYATGRGDENPLIWMTWIAAIVVAGVSFLDDFRFVSVPVRLGAHLAVAFVAVGSLAYMENSYYLLALSPILALWIVGHTNAFNFMDGINGIATMQASVTALGMAVLSGMASGNWLDPWILASFALAGAALGFLPHNFPRARMFMGDVGSIPLGFLLATWTLFLAQTHGWWLIVPLCLLHANFVLDTSFTLWLRFLRGEKLGNPHRDHFYQLLVRSGKSHTFVTLTEGWLQVLVFLLMCAYLQAGYVLRILLVLAVFGVWGFFFRYAWLQFQYPHTESKPREDKMITLRTSDSKAE